MEVVGVLLNSYEYCTNVALYAIACIMYMIVGYNIMYGDGVNGLVPELTFFLAEDNTVDEVLKSGGGLSSGCSKKKRWKA